MRSNIAHYPSLLYPKMLSFWVYALDLLYAILGIKKFEIAEHNGKHTPDSQVGGVCTPQRGKRVITSRPKQSNP